MSGIHAPAPHHDPVAPPQTSRVLPHQCPLHFLPLAAESAALFSFSRRPSFSSLLLPLRSVAKSCNEGYSPNRDRQADDRLTCRHHCLGHGTWGHAHRRGRKTPPLLSLIHISEP